MMISPQTHSRIVKFVSGEDVSTEAANIIETALDDCYPSDDYIQETVEMLAMYRPEGGDFAFDVVKIQRRLAETIDRLRKMV